jgi:hypothetical protein
MYLQIRHLQLKTKENASRYGSKRTKRGTVVLERLHISIYGQNCYCEIFYATLRFIYSELVANSSKVFIFNTNICESVCYANNLSSISSYLSRVCKKGHFADELYREYFTCRFSSRL